MANLKSRDIILGEPGLIELDTMIDIKHKTTSIKPKHQPRMELKMMQRSGDIDRITSAAQWMQPTADSENDLEDQYKDYAYNETDYEDSDSDVEEGEIKQEKSDEEDPVTLQESEDIIYEQCTETT